jgi:hypothetical protein
MQKDADAMRDEKRKTLPQRATLRQDVERGGRGREEFSAVAK